ncbi:hypothetical protein [Spiroplasma endosymbiont of Cantharis rufa]|uniref:hypothetical protein n=1 Tax=Spiroplasma endosymbiont of Cantharis rufa TaxID=3066279 RepID=UPI0030D466F8
MNKKIFDLNEELEFDLDYVYFNQGISNCLHDNIAEDKRDSYFKCTKCFTIFTFTSMKQAFKFKKRILTNFDFEQAENNYKLLKNGDKNEI